MAAQLEARVGISRIGSWISKNLRAVGNQSLGTDESLDRATAFVMRVKLNERLWPESSARVKFVDLVLDLTRADTGEGTRESGVLLQEMIVLRKYAHQVRTPSRCPSTTNRRSPRLHSSHYCATRMPHSSLNKNTI